MYGVCSVRTPVRTEAQSSLLSVAVAMDKKPDVVVYWILTAKARHESIRWEELMRQSMLLCFFAVAAASGGWAETAPSRVCSNFHDGSLLSGTMMSLLDAEKAFAIKTDSVTVDAETPGAADLEDVTGRKWRLRAVFLDYNRIGVDPTLNRFQSQQTRRKETSKGNPLVLRVGQMDVMIPLESLASMRKIGDRTFVVTYRWNERQHSIEGEVETLTGPYDKYNVVGTCLTHNVTVTVRLDDVRQLSFNLPAPSAPQNGDRLPRPSATVELKNGGRVPISRLKRVFCSTLHCWHDETLPVAIGAAKVEVPFAVLTRIRFRSLPDELRLTYHVGTEETVKLWKGDRFFDNEYAGLSGFTEIGEVFISAGDAKAIEFEAAE